MDPLVLVALGGVGLVAGFVDAIAGGGGLIAAPALLSAGLPPVAALATTKVQSIVGTAIATLTYWRGGAVSLGGLWPAIAAGLAGSFIGAATVRLIDPAILTVAVPVALIAVALYFLFAPKLGDQDRRARLALTRFAPLMGFVLGVYDGLLGPGTGTFLTVGFVVLFGLGLTRAVGSAKAINLATNLGALALFIPVGEVFWPAALAMAAGQVVGGWLGARTGLRIGARIIRPVVVLVSVALALRLLFGD